jgi:hypothetical protein
MYQLNIKQKIYSNYIYLSVIRKILLIVFVTGLLNACASKIGIPEQADKLGTDSIYHCVLDWNSDCNDCPNEFTNADCALRKGLKHDGILLGIEKSAKVGGCQKPKGNGLKDVSNIDLSAGAKKHLLTRLNDKKSMYLSHAVEYQSSNNGGIFYNSYNFKNIDDNCVENYPNSQSLINMDPPPNLYLRGEKELWKLKKRLKTRLKSAKNSGSPYTHIILMAMGWNNDQPESLYRYNKIVENLINVANSNTRIQFKPFVVGVSWPSVWRGFGSDRISKLAGHLGSYANKSNDADEIGYTILNRVLNNVLLELKQEAGIGYDEFKLITIGHSMGARMTTRAVFSKSLLSENASTAEVDLVIGLQGAFSINRFIKGAGKEGAPYANYDKMKTKFIMTWSSEDKANPMSALISGSRHIGGKLGYKGTLASKKAYSFSHINWPKGDGNKLSEYEKEICSSILHDNSIAMVNLSSIVEDHNDVLDDAIGRFLWCSISQFAK